MPKNRVGIWRQTKNQLGRLQSCHNQMQYITHHHIVGVNIQDTHKNEIYKISQFLGNDTLQEKKENIQVHKSLVDVSDMEESTEGSCNEPNVI